MGPLREEAETGEPRRPRLRSQCRPEGAEAEVVPRREPEALTLHSWNPGPLDEAERRVGSEGGLESDRSDRAKSFLVRSAGSKSGFLLFDGAMQSTTSRTA
jgi:hypothetical protein